MTDVTSAERQRGLTQRLALVNLCVCQHALDRHTIHGTCRDCRRKPWPCSHFVSMAAVRASDRTVGPAWPKLVVAVLVLLLTSCAVAPCLERCAASPGTFGGCWCVERVIVGGR